MSRYRNLHIGCSGFSYKDWRGTFYPSNLPQSDLIRYYESFFDVLEVNYTYYSFPHTYTMESFLEKTRRLRFSVKVNRLFTHDRIYSKEDVKRFLRGIEPLTGSPRFIALLFQFPQSFGYTAQNLDYVKRLSESFSGYEKVIELRSRSWGRSELFGEIEILGFSLVNVDAPKVRGMLVGPWKSVGSINYVRLHGRNAERWFENEESYERYDYLYSEEELRSIKERIERIYGGKDTYVFFNNHYRGKGALNALQLKELFGEKVSVPRGLMSIFSGKLWE
ncbi:DUF72 domain-containing protein [Hydrogenivirga sp.]